MTRIPPERTLRSLHTLRKIILISRTIWHKGQKESEFQWTQHAEYLPIYFSKWPYEHKLDPDFKDSISSAANRGPGLYRKQTTLIPKHAPWKAYYSADLTNDDNWEINHIDVEETTSTVTSDDISEKDMKDPDMMAFMQDCYNAYKTDSTPKRPPF